MKKILILSVMLLVLSMSALAYTVDWTINANMPLGASSYFCLGDVCSAGTLSFNEQEFGASSVELNFVDANAGDNPDKYAIYFYPQDACHVPTNMEMDFSSSGTFSSPLNFYKQDAAHCGSEVKDPVLKVNGIETVCVPINEFQVDCGEVPLGSLLTMSADMYDAWIFTLDFAPSGLESYYTSYVDYEFSVNSIVEESGSETITPQELKVTKSFDYTVPALGDYTLRIATTMDNDCKCLGSNYKYREVIVRVTDNEIPEFTIIGIISLVALLGIFIYKRR